MAQSHSCLLTHLVFSTKGRIPALTPEVNEPLYAYLGGTMNDIGCRAIQAGGHVDHVHILFALSRTLSIADTVEAVKTSSSKWMKRQGRQFVNFQWQAGYGAFSLGRSGLPRAISYIRNQARHHRKLSFRDEYLALLDRYECIYDEGYLWD